MNTFIAILRGINVSGKRIIKMDALKQLFTDLNFKNIQTYIQSGNVIFKSSDSDVLEIKKRIENGILNAFSLEVPVIIITSDELESVVSENPFTEDETKNSNFLHVTFLSEKPKEEYVIQLNGMNFPEEEFQIKNNAIYLYCPNGYGNSKLTNTFFEKKLKTTATTRNWKTTKELLNIAAKIANS